MRNKITIFILLSTAFLLTYLRNIENKVIPVNKKDYMNNINVTQSNNQKKREKLKNMAKIERNKLRLKVEHDGLPSTNTYPVILDASGSYDPDAVDEINFKWNQISGPPIVLSPNVFRSKVSFEGTPGEYTFELQVTDNYGAVTKMIKTVIIEREPNEAPIIDMKIRQGSELK